MLMCDGHFCAHGKMDTWSEPPPKVMRPNERWNTEPKGSRWTEANVMKCNSATNDQGKHFLLKHIVTYFGFKWSIYKL